MKGCPLGTAKKKKTSLSVDWMFYDNDQCTYYLPLASTQ